VCICHGILSSETRAYGKLIVYVCRLRSSSSRFISRERMWTLQLLPLAMLLRRSSSYKKAQARQGHDRDGYDNCINRICHFFALCHDSLDPGHMFSVSISHLFCNALRSHAFVSSDGVLKIGLRAYPPVRRTSASCSSRCCSFPRVRRHGPRSSKLGWATSSSHSTGSGRHANSR